MSVPIKCECPKCHADRTMLDTSFGLPGNIAPEAQPPEGEAVNLTCAMKVRLVLCPRCHLIELYHDVGSPKLC